LFFFNPQWSGGFMSEHDDLRDAIQFHGHLCPGLALGFRVAKAALRELEAERPQDEELVAIVENDSCAVDAIQYVTGCTFGKGNLVFRDHGKHVYSFFNRGTGKGVRISEDFRGFENDSRFADLKKRQDAGEDVAEERRSLLMEKAAAILKADEKELLSIRPETAPQPAPAKVRTSLHCPVCGEKFMESRGRKAGGMMVCIPCSEKK
jgi:formylmethanofuran dehydrogenase subunit E